MNYRLTGIVIKLPVVLPLVAFRLAYVFLVIGVATILFKMLLPKG